MARRGPAYLIQCRRRSDHRQGKAGPRRPSTGSPAPPLPSLPTAGLQQWCTKASCPCSLVPAKAHVRRPCQQPISSFDRRRRVVLVGADSIWFLRWIEQWEDGDANNGGSIPWYRRGLDACVTVLVLQRDRQGYMY